MIESTEEIVVEPVTATVGQNPSVLSHLAELINEVYAVAENGMWNQGATRTSTAEITELARSGHMFVARRGVHIVGCVRVVHLAGRVAQFGMLAADPQLRNLGIGRALVQFAENQAKDAASDVMQLEVIQPRDFSLPSKEFLTSWYTRMGYRVVRADPSDTVYPALMPMLRIPCVVITYQKDIRV